MMFLDSSRSAGNRSRLGSTIDTSWGVVILILYFLYLNLVKGMLSIFDCSENSDGIWILDADPAIRCYEVFKCAF
jgi:hypothetical protein